MNMTRRTCLDAALGALSCIMVAAPAASLAAKAADGKACADLKQPRKKGENPFAGACFLTAPDSNAARQAATWRAARPQDAALMEKLAAQATGIWIGDWSGSVEQAVRTQVATHAERNALPVFVLYNLPDRDCGKYSKGGVASADAYKKWIDGVARGIGRSRVVIVLEPDALGLLADCLSPENQARRLEMIRYAVKKLEGLGGAAVYVDAGHSAWMPLPVAVKRLKDAGVADATGFALNVSNYRATGTELEYGRAISKALGGKHFIIDTSRNGSGPPNATGEGAWCNPDGRAAGAPPTTSTGDPLADAFFWVKPPGESDGTCNGGPKAGMWWPEQALGLAKRASW